MLVLVSHLNKLFDAPVPQFPSAEEELCYQALQDGKSKEYMGSGPEKTVSLCLNFGFNNRFD